MNAQQLITMLGSDRLLEAAWRKHNSMPMTEGPQHHEYCVDSAAKRLCYESGIPVPEWLARGTGAHCFGDESAARERTRLFTLIGPRIPAKIPSEPERTTERQPPQWRCVECGATATTQHRAFCPMSEGGEGPHMWERIAADPEPMDHHELTRILRHGESIEY